MTDSGKTPTEPAVSVPVGSGTAKLTLVGYLRVSTIGQAKDGLGLPVQHQAIQGWADLAGHRLARVIADEGVSGTLPAQERPGLSEVLDLVHRGQVDGLVVHRLDRLARLLSVQEAALASCWSAGGRVFEVATGEVLADDPADPLRTAIRQILAAVAQLERGMIVARMRAGRELKASRGGFAGGAPAYGFRSDGDGNLVSAPEELATLRRLLELRREGLSLRATGDRLTEEGHLPKRASAWCPETVRRLEQRHPRPPF